jgi:hypothetical protein
VTETLCGQGSPSSAELDDLFLDAMTFDTAAGDPDDLDAVPCDLSDDNPGDA